MAKRKPLFADRDLTLRVNDLVLSYLEDLAQTGLYGNSHDDAADIVFRYGLSQLIETGKLQSKKQTFPRDEGGT